MSEMLFHGKRILFLGAHPDDIELGCGALIAELAGKTELLAVTMSDNHHNSSLHSLPEQHAAAMATLGLQPDQVRLLTFETRRFPQFRQEILEAMIQLLKEFDPEIVFVHSPADLHQDHKTMTEEAMRAYRGRTVLGFDVIRSSHGFFPTFLIPVSEGALTKKLNALACYTTYRDKYYFDPELTRATLIRNGALCERKLAEGFDILRMVASFGRLNQDNK